MGIGIWIVIFVVSLIVLIKSSDFFIDIAEKIGSSLGIPPMVIGVTIVALGTSLPELASSIASILKDSSEIVVSNVMGSNITNVFLVVGAMSFLGRGKLVGSKPNWKDDALLFGSAAFLCYAILDQQFSYVEGLICIGGILLFVLHNVLESVKAESSDEETEAFKWYWIPMLILTGLGISLSADYNIQSIIAISEVIGVGKEIISAGAVALGTSLPELFVSLAAVRKNNISIAIGNILGSNIFNIFGVMGIGRMVGDLAIPSLAVGLQFYLMIAATLALIIAYKLKKLNGIFGIALLLVYAYFLYSLVQMSIQP